MNHELKERLCEQYTALLEEIAETDMTERHAEIGKTAISAILKLKTLEGMEGFSNHRSYRGDHSYDHAANQYDDGHSYRRGRGMDGRYVSRTGASMRDKLESLMQSADEKERSVLQEILARI